MVFTVFLVIPGSDSYAVGSLLFMSITSTLKPGSVCTFLFFTTLLFLEDPLIFFRTSITDELIASKFCTLAVESGVRASRDWCELFKSEGPGNSSTKG